MKCNADETVLRRTGIVYKHSGGGRLWTGSMASILSFEVLHPKA
jgi:hypothetical protein